MSDQMLLYILRAPQSPDDHLAMVQLISRAREAADLLEANAAEIATLRKQVSERERWTREADELAESRADKIDSLDAEIKRLKGELKIKSEWIGTRQCAM